MDKFKNFNSYSSNDWLLSVSDETQLHWYDNKLIALWEEKNAYRGRHSRLDVDIEKDIEDIGFRRKILLEKMSVTKSSQNQFNNSQIHFGTGDNVGKNKIKSKYSEKWLWQISMTILGGLIIAYLAFKFGWQ